MRPTCRELFTEDFDYEGEAATILENAIAEYKPAKVFAMFSGGHDSLCCSHLASRASRFDGCVHVNTQVGVEETRDFVRATCKEHGWPLREMLPPQPPFRDKHGKPWGVKGETAYEAICKRWGFPGPYITILPRCSK